jgi:acetoin:2,6-dichlorophenolindophenol oxidoreductase subunit beta
VVPLGQAAVLRAGADVTLVSYSKSVTTCLAAADQLAQRGIDAEVIDLRTLKPLDEATILRSVRKTGRLVVVHEAAAPCGVGAEVAAIVSEKAFAALKAPVRRITGPDAPAPSSWMLEQAALPQADGIARAALELVGAAAVPA